MAKPTKTLLVISVVAIIFLGIFVYVKFIFVFGEGVKTGELNYLVHKGYLFKTYEGNLIQAGFRGKQTGTVQSYVFEFSVTDPKLAEELMHLGGRSMDLHYKEYLGRLPWRGYSKFVVDKIVAVHDE